VKIGKIATGEIYDAIEALSSAAAISGGSADSEGKR
jgi:hypothetical protein